MPLPPLVRLRYQRGEFARLLYPIIKFFIKPAPNNITDAGSQAPAWEPCFPKLSLREFWTLTFPYAVQIGSQSLA
ncbi:hypothetical protein CEK71_11215 [Methylovulum psychrotolerans]|uniref:Uncharacterized protein n=1 Tax=Methylovulum psychrotolerans TaxID=1704499 RepID=A0A1Z4BZ60_9GAMM|nr:hypothetical protein CEK71_11215 [Methylovulum psychrotolerans]